MAQKNAGGVAPDLFEGRPGPPGPARLQKRTPKNQAKLLFAELWRSRQQNGHASELKTQTHFTTTESSKAQGRQPMQNEFAQGPLYIYGEMRAQDRQPKNA